ncbi:MAG: ABC transporter substrate-binding protein [Planctomycetota bacterium]|nr:ABC transporter substrate-binding protein [Planctomycetota bacterium]
MTQHSTAGTQFQSQKFTDFPSMKEALIARKIDATFMNAPLAPKLVMDGVPVKIVYLGHRDGTALVVKNDGPVQKFEDLRGKVVAIPGRFSNQNIFLHRMMKQLGMPFDSLTIKEIPPPEHPSSLASGAIDAYIIGEPHAAKAEMEGYGRVLMRLDEDRLTGAQHRKDAALVASGKAFYNQPTKLLEYVLLKDVTRVSYTNLMPPKKDFDEIMDLAVELGILPKRIPFEDYVDTSFAPDLQTVDLDFDRLPGIEEAKSQ